VTISGGIKRWYVLLGQQAAARHNLRFFLRDPRAFAPILNKDLISAALTWPQVLPFRPSTILDVGAYTGQVSTELAELYRPAFIGLVEPLPDLASALTGKSLARCQRIFACAVGRADGTATIRVIASRHSSSLLPISPDSGKLFGMPMHQVGTLAVPMRTLDSIFKACGLSTLDLLKVDVQGYELEAFAGGVDTLARTRVIVSEVSFFEHYLGQPLFESVYTYLKEAGFDLRSTFGWSYDPDGMPLQCDAVFIRRKVER
jgi:FkbM family methyltransferase